jgi:hypothetical protein
VCRINYLFLAGGEKEEDEEEEEKEITFSSQIIFYTEPNSMILGI